MVSNQSYTIEELINRMIIYSDNDAYNDLTKNIDGNEILQTYKDLDVDISQIFINPNGNILTVRDYASFFRILYNASYLNKDMSEKALGLLSQTEYKQGLVAGVPSKIQVAHKFGERIYSDTNEVQLHDCGIVYLPKKPYLLCVMTRGQDLNKATQTIKTISQKVFDYINTN
jgi:beta-lactamase class A